MRAVTAGELQQVAKGLFRPDNRFLAVIGPLAGIKRPEIERLLQQS